MMKQRENDDEVLANLNGENVATFSLAHYWLSVTKFLEARVRYMSSRVNISRLFGLPALE